MPKDQTWFAVKDLRERWRVSRSWISKQCREHKLIFVTTVNGVLFHRDTVHLFEELHGRLLHLGQVEKEVEDIARSQLQLEFSDVVHELSSN